MNTSTEDTMGGDAFSRTYSDHRSAVYRVARCYCDDTHAGDVVQDVFTRVWARPESFDPRRGDIDVYLRVITRGVAIDHVRKRVRAIDREERARTAGAPEPHDDLAAPIIAAQSSARIRAAVARLSDDEREVITAAFFLGVTYREIAEKLQLPEGTVKSRIRRGLKRLRADLLASENDRSFA